MTDTPTTVATMRAAAIDAITALRGRDVPERDAEDTGEAYDLAIDEAIAAIRALPISDRTCPLGEDCDLTTAWMAGQAEARNRYRARIEALEAENARLRESWVRFRHVAIQNSDDIEAWDKLIAAMDQATTKGDDND